MSIYLNKMKKVSMTILLKRGGCRSTLWFESTLLPPMEFSGGAASMDRTRRGLLLGALLALGLSQPLTARGDSDAKAVNLQAGGVDAKVPIY
jgi:hypothetical protein